MEYTHRLEELRKMILSKCDIRFITPADCKRISIEISRCLHKNVSETTIKRLFGFAVVKHKFSTFTLTTLAEYVDLPVVNSPKNSFSPVVATGSWTELKSKADKITKFTLKTIRNRSGIPYDLTISRKYAEQDFEEFYKGDCIFTSLISQPGYGKSILLSHLAEDIFYHPEARYKDNIVVFVKAFSLFTKDNLSLNLEEQLKIQLKIDHKENILDYINRILTEKGGKFILIIDGFAELVLKKEDKNLLFDSIINLICSLEDCRNFKLILSMRSTTWTRFYDRIRHSSFLKSVWFPGNFFSQQELSNVPPLTEKEVNIIISKINQLEHKDINPRLKAQLKFPFHIQLYYQLKEEDPGFNYYTNITFFELVSRFIQEKIYRSNYYTEKIGFLKRIIQFTDYGRAGNSVEKDDMLKELASFRNAYMELLADGILMEEKRSENSHPKEYVRFVHPHMFEYFLFVEILEKFGLQVSRSFFDYINQEYEYNQVRFQLLQWTTRFLIKTGNFNSLKSLFSLNLSSYETNYLILFIAEEIKYRSKYTPDMIMLLNHDHFHEVIISLLTNFDFIDSCYREAILTLIEISSCEEHLLIYHSILSILDVLSLNKERIANSLQHIKPLKAHGWLIEPALALEVVYARINGQLPPRNRFVDQLSLLKKGKLPPEFEGVPFSTSSAISYLLIILVNAVTGDTHAAERIMSGLLKLQPDYFSKRSNFTIYMLSLQGLFHSRAGLFKKADQAETMLSGLAEKNYRFTKYQENISGMLTSEQAFSRGEYGLALEQAKECLVSFKRNNIILVALQMYDLIIRIYTALGSYEMVNEYKYEKLNLQEERQIAVSMYTSVPDH